MTFFEQLSMWGSRTKRRIFHHIFLTRFVFISLAIVLALGAIVVFFLPVIRVGKDLFFGEINVLSVVFQNQAKIKETDGRTNILFLGTGGAGHEGTNLTDSMVLVSLGKDPVVLVSIPRDIYLDSLLGKINTAYALGEEKQKGSGLLLAKGATSQILGIPVHYAIQADFSAFQKIIDLLGGVDVKVEQTLDDGAYPIKGKGDELCGRTGEEVRAFMVSNPTEPEQWQFFPCRYEQLHFDPGVQHMNGETALKFVRSRHAQGDEGTDFARSRRQQQVLAGVKAKVFSTDTFLNPKKIEDIYLVLKDNVSTDLTNKEINDLIPIVLGYRDAIIGSVVLDMAVFDNPPEDERGWILLPKGGDFSVIQKMVKDKLEGKE